MVDCIWKRLFYCVYTVGLFIKITMYVRVPLAHKCGAIVRARTIEVRVEVRAQSEGPPGPYFRSTDGSTGPKCGRKSQVCMRALV